MTLLIFLGLLGVGVYAFKRRKAGTRHHPSACIPKPGPGTWNRESQEVTTALGRYRLNLVSGLVVSTDQRSDTHLSSSASMVAGEGFSSASVRTSSRVSVVRDIWLEVPNGGQEHIRIDGDVPVSTGQSLDVVYVCGNSLRGTPFSTLFKLHNRTTNQTWTFDISDKLGSRFSIYPIYWLIAWFIGGPILVSALLAPFQLPTASAPLGYVIGATLVPLAVGAAFPGLLLLARRKGTPSRKQLVEARTNLLAFLNRGGNDLVRTAPQGRVIETVNQTVMQ